MKTSTLFLVASLAVALCSSRPAQAETLHLTIHDAVHRAAGTTTEVSESRRDLSVAKANLARSQALLPDDPVVAVGAYHSTLKEDIFNEQEEFIGRRGYGPNYTFSLSQELEVAGQRAFRVDASAKEVDRARFALKSQRDSLAATVKTAFVHALIESDKLAVAQRAHDATVELTSPQPDGARVTQSARVSANLLRIQAAHTRSELAQAQLSRAQALAALKRLCRIPVSQTVELSGTADTQAQALAPLEELVRRALANRPDLAALQAGLESADANLAAKHREKIPNVTVSAAVSQFAGATLAGGDVSIPIPIFHGKVGDLEEAIAERNHAGRQLDLGKADVEKEVVDAYQAYTVAAVALQAYQREIVPLNEENLRIQRNQLKQDDIDVGELISSQVDYFAAQTEYLSAVEEYNTHFFELQRAVGGDVGIAPDDTAAPK